jgi:hypothetical protein
MEAALPRTAALVLAALASSLASCAPEHDPFRPAPAPPQSLVTPAARPTPSPPPEPVAVDVPDDATAHLRWVWLELNGVAFLAPAGPQPGYGSPWVIEHYVDPCRGGLWPYTIVRVYTGAVVLRFDWPEARFRVRGQPPTHDETQALVHMLGSAQGSWAGGASEIGSPAPTPVACATWDGFGPPPG